jgi:6-phosphogluconolactonase (cycloisomerase 2 family)
MQNGGTDTCWIVTTDDQSTGYATSFFEDGRISSYEIDDTGIVRLIRAVASGEDAMNDNVAMGASDLALSRDSGFLYQLNSVQGTVSAFRTHNDGTLTLIEMETPFPQPTFGPGMGQAAPTGLAGS